MKILTYLKRNKISLADAARKSGVQYSTLYKIAKMRSTPTIKIAAKLDKFTKGAVSFRDYIK